MELVKLRLTVSPCWPASSAATQPAQPRPAPGAPRPSVRGTVSFRALAHVLDGKPVPNPGHVRDGLRPEHALDRAGQPARRSPEALDFRLGAVQRRKPLLHILEPSQILLARLGAERALGLLEFPI